MHWAKVTLFPGVALGKGDWWLPISSLFPPAPPPPPPPSPGPLSGLRARDLGKVEEWRVHGIRFWQLMPKKCPQTVLLHHPQTWLCHLYIFFPCFGGVKGYRIASCFICPFSICFAPFPPHLIRRYRHTPIPSGKSLGVILNSSPLFPQHQQILLVPLPHTSTSLIQTINVSLDLPLISLQPCYIISPLTCICLCKDLSEIRIKFWHPHLKTGPSTLPQPPFFPWLQMSRPRSHLWPCRALCTTAFPSPSLSPFRSQFKSPTSLEKPCVN